MKSFIKGIIKKIPILNKVGRNFLEARRKRRILNGPSKLSNYNYLSIYLSNKDRKFTFGNPELKKLHKQLDRLRKEQLASWNSFVYCKGYYYQGYHKIGINGIKPTELRMENYNVFDFFNENGKVLDIGSNSGFLSCYLTDYYKEVVGIELNPYLVKMGETVRSYLGKSNLRFIEANFMEYGFNEKFDAVFSLSNHFTIDGNLNMSFELYIKKIYDLMNDGGVLFFESHDINGDDSDLEEKFKIAGKYFSLEKYKMVKAFYPADIDKLFVIFMKKKSILDVSNELTFNLKTAKNQYNYINT